MTRIRHERIGDVFLRNFDLGMIKTLGGVLIGSQYYLPLDLVPGVLPPLFTEFSEDSADTGEPMPGIPVIFSNAGDAVERYVIPCIRVRREDPTPALERWLSNQDKYRAPAAGAEEITVQYGSREKTGYSKYEMQPAGWPYDIPYTVTVEANGERARTNAQIMLRHAMGIFGPYGVVTVYDDAGEERKYNVFGEGPSDLSAVADIRDRTVIYALSLRISAELDVLPKADHQAVTSPPTVTAYRKE